MIMHMSDDLQLIMDYECNVKSLWEETTFYEINDLMIRNMNFENMDWRWTTHGDVNNVYNN